MELTIQQKGGKARWKGIKKKDRISIMRKMRIDYLNERDAKNRKNN